MKKYKIVMLAFANDNIIMKDNIASLEEAEQIKARIEQEDNIHYFEIQFEEE